MQLLAHCARCQVGQKPVHSAALMDVELPAVLISQILRDWFSPGHIDITNSSTATLAAAGACCLLPSACGFAAAGWLGYLGTLGHKTNNATTNNDSTINCGLNWASLPPRPSLCVWLGSMALLLLLSSLLATFSPPAGYKHGFENVGKQSALAGRLVTKSESS